MCQGFIGIPKVSWDRGVVVKFASGRGRWGLSEWPLRSYSESLHFVGRSQFLSGVSASMRPFHGQTPYLGGKTADEARCLLPEPSVDRIDSLLYTQKWKPVRLCTREEETW